MIPITNTASAIAPAPSGGSPPPASPEPQPLAVYVHWPFCVSKCPYCDFNSHVRARVDEEAWAEALITDLTYEATHTPAHRVASVFFGGGTPSLMRGRTAGAIIDAVTRLWPISSDVEITLEANPTSVEAANFTDFAEAGVNRVSLGLQALDDAALRFLGRPHSLAEGLAALDIAQHHFARVSFDLISARPGQTVAAWEAELTQALALGTEHLSLYQLTIEPGTQFATLHKQGRLTQPDEDTALALFEATQALTEAAGLPAYEVSNHAHPGAESRHNLAYWTYSDYVGVGPGAHGRRGGTATCRHRLPEAWMRAFRAHGHGTADTTTLTAADRAREALLMGLRLTEGITANTFRARTGTTLADAIDPLASRRLDQLGLVQLTPERLRLTPAGRPLLNAILAELVR